MCKHGICGSRWVRKKRRWFNSRIANLPGEVIILVCPYYEVLYVCDRPLKFANPPSFNVFALLGINGPSCNIATWNVRPWRNVPYHIRKLLFLGDAEYITVQYLWISRAFCGCGCALPFNESSQKGGLRVIRSRGLWCRNDRDPMGAPISYHRQWHHVLLCIGKQKCTVGTRERG
jgi:hypothetical protein